jgi:hypothetical protein
MAEPSRDSYAALANLAVGPPSLVQREAALALAEIDKWRLRDEEDEKAWQIEMSGD